LIRKSEERLRALVTASADVVYRMSPDWSEIYHLEGKDFITDAEGLGGSWTDRYTHPEDRSRVLAAIGEAIRSKGVFQFEHRVVRVDGSLGWISSRAIPLLDGHGEIVEWFGAASDVTARKQMEKELQEARGKLELRVTERTRELESVHSNLRDLTGKLIQLQDEERKRIARDLHDSAGQTLAVLGMSLGELEQFANDGNAHFGDKVREAQELLRRVTQEIRTTSYLLHPPLLDEIGFVEALKVYVDGLMQRTHLKINLQVSEEFGRFPKELELAMFRMIQECLTNILRHAQCDLAEIRISQTLEKIILEVQDNGKGIPAEKLVEINENKSGVGIRGMRDRVRHLNGEVAVFSTGSGTTVAITFPNANPRIESQAVCRVEGERAS